MATAKTLSPAFSPYHQIWRRPGFFIGTLSFAAIVVILAFTAWEILDDRHNTLDNANRSAQMAAEALKEHTSEALLDATAPMWSVIELIRAEGGLARLNREQLHQTLKMQVAPGTPLDRLTLLSAEGELLASSVAPTPPGDFRFRHRQSITEHLDGDTGDRVVVGIPTQLSSDSKLLEPMKQPGSSTWVIPVTRALRNRDGRLEGVVVALFRVDYFRHFYSVLGSHRDSIIALSRQDGILLARHPFRAEFLGTSNLAWRQKVDELDAHGEMIIVPSRIDNVERLIARRDVRDLPLTVFVGLSTEEVLGGWRLRAIGRIAAAAIFSLVVLALSLLLMRKLGALTESERRYRVLFDSTTVGILLIDNQTVLDGNREAHTILKAAPGESLSGLDLTMLIGSMPARLIRRYAAARQNGDEEESHFEWQMEARDGSLFWASVSLSCFDVGGRQYVLAMLRDISAQKHAESQLQGLNQYLEERVKNRTRQLAQVNADLQAFNYSASHDLRAPIRRIRSFIELLHTEFGDRLDAEGDRVLGRIDVNAARMDEMLNNFMLLFTTNQSNFSPRQVDLGEMARGIITELAADQPQRKYRFDAEPDLLAYGDEGLLRMALTNLLGNAWKFTAQNEVAHISIGRSAMGFFVRDDGVGFDPEHADKLFTAFHRLHAESEFEGTGIGLAIVKRVIERHGGRVWAQAAPGNGATFFFSLATAEVIDRMMHGD